MCDTTASLDRDTPAIFCAVSSMKSGRVNVVRHHWSAFILSAVGWGSVRLVMAKPDCCRCETLLTGVDGGQLAPWAVERAMRKARSEVNNLPAGFRYHDLRRYFASLLIADGADVKTLQARLRHASAMTTLDTYGHIWPDRDESTRAIVDAVLTAYLTEQRRNSATAEH